MDELSILIVAEDPLVRGGLATLLAGQPEVRIAGLLPLNRNLLRELERQSEQFHVNALLGKLGAQSRTDAVVRATRMGLIIL